MPATATTVSAIVKPVVQRDRVLIKWVNRELFQILNALGVQEVTQNGGDSFDWRVNRATGNSSVEVYSEGQAPLAAGNQTYASPELPFVYMRCIAEVTGHARDQLRSAWVDGFDAANLEGELMGAMEELEDLKNVTFLGSTQNGLQIAIDSTGTYAGLNRATITDFASFETAGGAAALTIAMLRDTWEGVRDNDRGGNVQSLVGPWNQLSNYIALAQGTTTANFVRHINEPGKGPSIDLGANMAQLTFNGVPFYGCADLTDTEILMLSNIQQDWKFAIQRPLDLLPYGVSDDTVARIQVSLASTPVCLNPRRQGKVTDVAA